MLKSSVAKSYAEHRGLKLEWLDKNGYTMEEITYAESLQWVGWRQGQGVSSRTINYDILTVNHFYKSHEKESPLE